MKYSSKIIILLFFNYLFASSCNHLGTNNQKIDYGLDLNSELNCQSLSEKIPRRFIKTASVVDNKLYVYSQKSNSKMDANQFDLDSLNFERSSSFSNANSFKEYENGLLIEMEKSTVIMVGAKTYYVDFKPDTVRYFKQFKDLLYVLIDKGEYSELYRIDPSNKKTDLLKRINIDYTDVRFVELTQGINVVFLQESPKSSTFVSYSIFKDLSKVAKFRIEAGDIIDWDVIANNDELNLVFIAANNFYSDQQFMVRTGLNLKNNKKLSEIRKLFEFRNYDTIKLQSINETLIVVLESDKDKDRRLDFYDLSRGFLGFKNISVKRAFIKQWYISEKSSHYILSSVSPLGDKYYICN